MNLKVSLLFFFDELPKFTKYLRTEFEALNEFKLNLHSRIENLSIQSMKSHEK